MLDSDSWWRSLTAGIFLPDLGALIPSPTRRSLPFTLRTAGWILRRSFTHVRVRTSRSRALLWKKSRIRS